MIEQLPAHQRTQFEQLRARFLSGLPLRWQAIVEAGTDADRRARLHQLTGAAGAYGESGLSQASRRAEHALSGPGDACATALAALGECIRALTGAVPQTEASSAHNPEGHPSVSQSHDT